MPSRSFNKAGRRRQVEKRQEMQSAGFEIVNGRRDWVVLKELNVEFRYCYVQGSHGMWRRATFAHRKDIAMMETVETDLAEQLANIRRMELAGEFEAIPPLPEN